MAGSDEHKKIACKTYHEKLLNSLSQAISVSGIPRLIDKDMDRDKSVR